MLEWHAVCMCRKCKGRVFPRAAPGVRHAARDSLLQSSCNAFQMRWALDRVWQCATCVSAIQAARECMGIPRASSSQEVQVPLQVSKAPHWGIVSWQTASDVLKPCESDTPTCTQTYCQAECASPALSNLSSTPSHKHDSRAMQLYCNADISDTLNQLQPLSNE